MIWLVSPLLLLLVLGLALALRARRRERALEQRASEQLEGLYRRADGLSQRLRHAGSVARPESAPGVSADPRPLPAPSGAPPERRPARRRAARSTPGL